MTSAAVVAVDTGGARRAGPWYMAPGAQVAGSGGLQWGADTRTVHTSRIYTISTHNIYTEYLHSVSAVDIQRAGDNVSRAKQWGRGSAGLVTM